MRKIAIVIGCIILLASASVYGQKKTQKREQAKQKERIEQRAREQVDRVAEEMDLTKKQEKELFEYYAKIEAEKEREREIAQREREKYQAERNKKINENNKELERILGEEKFDEYQQRRNEKGIEKKDQIVDNFFDFLGDSFELDGKQRQALREYYIDQEKNVKTIIKKIESKQGDIEKIMKDQEEKLNDIFQNNTNQDTNFQATSIREHQMMPA